MSPFLPKAVFSNRRIADCIAEVLRTAGFEIEEVTYWEEEEEKVSLVAKKGRGSGGIAFLSHSDTVPGGNGWDPFQPQVVENRLVGRGSCDTKGPLAATIAATADLNAADLARPVMLVITSDEENDLKGAKRVIAESQWLAESRPAYGVICEATKLQPVYAHKGVVNIHATAHGIAAHSSSGKGVSSNFKIAPFLAEMAELNQRLRQDKRFSEPRVRSTHQRLQHGDQRRTDGPQCDVGQDRLQDLHPHHAGRVPGGSG